MPKIDSDFKDDYVIFEDEINGVNLFFLDMRLPRLTEVVYFENYDYRNYDAFLKRNSGKIIENRMYCNLKELEELTKLMPEDHIQDYLEILESFEEGKCMAMFELFF
jgi:hypothetical protein